MTKHAYAALDQNETRQDDAELPAEAIVGAQTHRFTKPKECIARCPQFLLRVETRCWETHVLLLIGKLEAVTKLFFPALQLGSEETAADITAANFLDEGYIHLARHMVVAIDAEDAVQVCGPTMIRPTRNNITAT